MEKAFDLFIAVAAVFAAFLLAAVSVGMTVGMIVLFYMSLTH